MLLLSAFAGLALLLLAIVALLAGDTGVAQRGASGVICDAPGS